MLHQRVVWMKTQLKDEGCADTIITLQNAQDENVGMDQKTSVTFSF